MMTTGLIARKRTLTADFSLSIINVVFLLLFFFILTGSVIQSSEMNITPPFTDKLPLERLPRPLITISDQNTLSLDGSEISLQALLTTISQSITAKDNKIPRLNILADGKLSAKTFLSTVDTLRLTGLPINIVTVRRLKKEPSG